MKLNKFALGLFFICFCFQINAQDLDLTKTPKRAYLEQAKAISKNIFTKLENGEHREIANFIVDNLGQTWDESKRINERNDYIGKFEIISLDPPKGIYGKINGFDLIDEGFLLGSDRVFRHTYITYHEGSSLLWEFRFYVNSNEKVTLNYIGWSEQNPFEYMSTPDMLLTRYN